MKEITKYVAKDGVEFYNQQECMEYETLIMKVDNIMSWLPKRPPGDGYYQHDIDDVNRAKLDILNICKENIDHKPLEKAWYRISCIDKYYREWDQPYFAANPHKGIQINLRK